MNTGTYKGLFLKNLFDHEPDATERYKKVSGGMC
ncbi:hypothetical protein SAMN05443144_101112 [Fodinibius roseus]|uniref:Uncharacterized protein n=1 Tax=Fodinibius roseus TaxID=1194090 RepID=A0A1M4SSM7_9BACT|nr:hypothetical protein SAMN05443144_101112 [Fodinibius roseus]